MAKQIKIEVLNDYQFSSGGEVRSIKAGDVFSESDFVALFKNKAAFDFKMKCTALKSQVKIIDGDKKIAEPITEIKEVVETMFLINEDIKKGKEIVLRKGEKKLLSEIVGIVGNKVGSLVKAKSLMEIKVTDNVSI